MRRNRLLDIWQKGGYGVNAWLHIPSSWSAEVMAHQGYDSLTIDFQHGFHDMQIALTMLQAISTTEAVPLVRVPNNDPAWIQRLLDAGAYGVICPMVNTAEECEQFVQTCRYPPEGIRSLGPTRARIYAGQDYAAEGIVPWAPLELGHKASDVLDRYAENKLIKGIRRIIQFESDIEFCLQPKFIRGVQLLEDYDLSFDICISHIQLKNTIEFVRQCPNVHFILDHIGKPDIKNQIFDPWKKELGELAQMENVHCKMSGLVTEADHERWTNEDLKPYIDHVIECFGMERICFGGDWPVSFQATEYLGWIETLDWALDGCTEEDKRKIYRENAIEFYNL